MPLGYLFHFLESQFFCKDNDTYFYTVLEKNTQNNPMKGPTHISKAKRC